MAPPTKLAKLDLVAERQKSAARTISFTTTTTNSSPSKAPAPTNADAGFKKASKPSKTVVKPATRPAKVAVAAHDAFSDLANAGKPKPAPSTNSRPASAGVTPAKPPPKKTRPASASPSPTKPATGTNTNTSASTKQPTVVAAKTAFEPKPSQDGGDDDDANTDKEAPAKGVYDIFVQTRRCEKLCVDLSLKLKHIRKMKKKFDDNDMYHSGEITQAEFFFILTEDRRPLTKGIFKYGGVAPDQKFLSFDEYLLCVVSFASLSPPEVYQFAFDLYDADHSGTLDEHEFATMSKELQCKQFCFPKNVDTAIKMLGGSHDGAGGRYVSEDGLVDLSEFMKFAKLFPLAFHPLFHFQKNVRKATLSESKWSRVVARKLKVHEMVSHMRRNYGATPELTLRARLWSLVDDEGLEIRRRAAQVYAQELQQRRLIGAQNDDAQ